MGVEEFKTIANKICDVLDDINNKELHSKIKEELTTLARKFVIYTKSTY